MKKQTLFLLLVPIIILAMTASTFSYCPPSGPARFFDEADGDEHPWGGENDGPTGDNNSTSSNTVIFASPFFVLDLVITIYQLHIVSVSEPVITTDSRTTETTVIKEPQTSNTPSQTGTQRGL